MSLKTTFILYFRIIIIRFFCTPSPQTLHNLLLFNAPYYQGHQFDNNNLCKMWGYWKKNLYFYFLFFFVVRMISLSKVETWDAWKVLKFTEIPLAGEMVGILSQWVTKQNVSNGESFLTFIFLQLSQKTFFAIIPDNRRPRSQDIIRWNATFVLEPAGHFCCYWSGYWSRNNELLFHLGYMFFC